MRKVTAIILLLFSILLPLLSGCEKKEQSVELTENEPKADNTGIHVIKNDNVPVNNHIQEYDNGDRIYFPPIEQISANETTHELYYNNSLSVYLFTKIDEEEQAELAKIVDGTVVGKIDGLNHIQIVVPESDLSTLESYVDKLMQQENVLYASVLYPIELSDTDIFDPTNTPWSDSNDNTTNSPSGNDWWAEAIGAYKSWQFSGITNPVTVGVVDSGFDINHEDLQKDGKPLIKMLNENSVSIHGTHVVGLIAAQENSIGIRGVADRADILCYDWEVESEKQENPICLITPETISELTAEMIGYAKMQHSPLVINHSWGIVTKCREKFNEEVIRGFKKDSSLFVRLFLKITDDLGLDESKIDESGYYESYLAYNEVLAQKTASECMVRIIVLLLEGNGDFLIVQGAGNGYEGMNRGIDCNTSGFYCGIDENLYNTVFSEKTRQKLSQSGITYSTLKDHIIIVGAVDSEKKGENYKLTAFSSFGENVDICAPGKDIYSTIPKDNNGFQYAKDNGTSMAAPLVSGSAAFIWSLDPSMEASQVKKSITGKEIVLSVSTEDARRTYPILNVGEAAADIVQTKCLNEYYDYIVENVRIRIESGQYLDALQMANKARIAITDKRLNDIYDICKTEYINSIIRAAEELARNGSVDQAAEEINNGLVVIPNDPTLLDEMKKYDSSITLYSSQKYSIIRQDKDDFYSHVVQVGIKGLDGNWIVPLSSDFIFAQAIQNESGQVALTGQHTEFTNDNVYYLGEDIFIMSLGVKVLSSSGFYLSVGSFFSTGDAGLNCYFYNVRTGAKASFNAVWISECSDGNMLMYNSDRYNSHFFRVDASGNIYELPVRDEVNDYPNAGISEGLFFANGYFYDLNGNIVIDLTKFAITRAPYFKNGKCTFEFKNNMGTLYKATIDKAGNLLSEPVKVD